MEQHRIRKAVKYARVSTEEQIEGTSIDGQHEECEHIAKMNYCQIVGSEDDPGISGTRYQNRPGIQRAIRMIERGEAEVILATKIDRIGRSARVILDIIERVRKAGGEVITLDYKFDDSPMGHFMLMLLAALAQLERDNTYVRTMTGKRRRAMSGIQTSRSYSPYGYVIPQKKDVAANRAKEGEAGRYIIEHLEAPVVRRIFAEYAEGRSLRSICKGLIADAIPTTRGGAWQPTTVRCMLTNPVYIGEAAFGRSEHKTDYVEQDDGTFKARTTSKKRSDDKCITINIPAIVDIDVWSAVQERLKEGKNVNGGNPTRRYMLTGLMRCPKCNRAMNGETHKRKAKYIGPDYRYYACPAARPSLNIDRKVCSPTTHNAYQVDEIIVNGFMDIIKHPEMIVGALSAYAESSGADDIQQQYEATKARLSKAREKANAAARAQVEAMASGIDADAYKNVLKEIATERAALEYRLAELDAMLKSIGTIDPTDEGSIISRAIADVEDVISSPYSTNVEKHDVLATVIKHIIPVDDGYEVTLRRVGSMDTVRRLSNSRGPAEVTLGPHPPGPSPDSLVPR